MYIKYSELKLRIISQIDINHTSPATPPVSGPAWDCPACGSKDNHYSFCPECGTKRPEISEELKPGEWRCICGYVTSSKFCPECGRAKI